MIKDIIIKVAKNPKLRKTLIAALREAGEEESSNEDDSKEAFVIPITAENENWMRNRKGSKKSKK